MNEIEGVQHGSEAAAPEAFVVSELVVSFTGASGAIVALDRVSLTIPAGEFVCIVGPSGQGKTTLLRTMAGLVRADSGEVIAHGRRIDGPGADRGMVFQQDTTFGWLTVEQNVAFGLQARGVAKAERNVQVAEWLENVGLSKFAKSIPKELSGGMKKRVAIAAVLANNPIALLMDEPFGPLDYGTKASLHELLLRLWAKTRCTIVFVTHDLEEAIKLGDRVVLIKHGRIVLDQSITSERPRDVSATGEFRSMRDEMLAHLQWED